MWQALGITGVEKVHTHLGDGIFINSQAGRTSLLPNIDYQLRVRFRDDAGSVSGYATRNFHTGASSSIFPLELQDIATLPANYWIDSLGSDAILSPSSPAQPQPQLRLESPAGGLLLAVTGFNGATNAITNPAALSDHADLRVVIIAASSVLSLGPTDLTVVDDHAASHTIFLPGINLAVGQRLDLWVAADGSTYYGDAARTAPDFSSLARPSNAAVNNPFTAMQPGFAVDVVAGGFPIAHQHCVCSQPRTQPDRSAVLRYGTVRRDQSCHAQLQRLQLRQRPVELQSHG